jgi:ABC-type phosphate transport system permease subunit
MTKRTKFASLRRGRRITARSRNMTKILRTIYSSLIKSPKSARKYLKLDMCSVICSAMPIFIYSKQMMINTDIISVIFGSMLHVALFTYLMHFSKQTCRHTTCIRKVNLLPSVVGGLYTLKILIYRLNIFISIKNTDSS